MPKLFVADRDPSQYRRGEGAEDGDRGKWRRRDTPWGPRLDGQVALVTGASSGIGKGVAIALAEAGAGVAVNYRGRKDEAGRRAIAVPAGVSDEASVRAMFRSIFSELERLDILVNNAGIQPDISKRAAGNADYAVSNGGAGFTIRINSIAPGAIRTPINAEAWESPEAYDRLMALVPHNRIGEPGDIGNAAVRLASDHSDCVAGTTLVIDGGMTVYPGFATGG